MINNDLDRILREKLDSHVEQVDSDVWAGIESRLNRRSRMRIIRKVSFYGAAAAACLMAGLFFFKASDNNVDILSPENITAVTSLPEVSIPAVTAPEEVMPMADQIINLGKATAAVARKKEVKVAENSKVEVIGKEEKVAVKVAVKEEVADNRGEEIADTKEKDKVVEKDESLPMGYWESWDDEKDQTASARRNTSLAILSNLSSVASENSFMVEYGPSHSSSQTGETPGTGKVQPIESPQFYMPVALGVQVKTSLTERLYLGAGINYTYLLTKYDAMVDKELFKGSYNQLHYVGIPINLYYNFVNNNKLGVYATLGGAIEKCVNSHYIYGSNVMDEKVKGLQYSANIGIGVEYWIVNRLGIYFDPTIAYFFDSSQPLSVRTAQPLQMKFELGFRFKI